MNRRDNGADKRVNALPLGDLFRVEALRLSKLSADERKQALAVHQRIADDARFSLATRNHARHVADTLESLIQAIIEAKKVS